jgi:membrane-bound lytic murein transglycosylase D
LKYVSFAFVTILTIILLLGYNKRLFSRGFFNLFSENRFSETGMERVKQFNPDKHTLYLPGLENKELFASIEDLSICRNEEVRKYIYLYLTSGREYIVKSIERSYIYIDIINEVMKKNPDIPLEIALLPLLESGFDPHAVSRSNAVGLWQFIAGTAQHFDLKNNKWVEERRDIEKSTEAAIRHLRYLYELMGSWDLALAAYNGGQGQVSRAMDKSGSKDIWELIQSGTLTRETSEYVPRYAALVIIYNNQRLFRIEKEIKKPEAEKTENVKLNYQMNISRLSEKCGIDIAEIKRYNPELNSSLTPPSSENYTLRLTTDSAKKFNSNIGGEYIGMITHYQNYILEQLLLDL